MHQQGCEAQTDLIRTAQIFDVPRCSRLPLSRKSVLFCDRSGIQAAGKEWRERFPGQQTVQQASGTRDNLTFVPDLLLPEMVDF